MTALAEAEDDLSTAQTSQRGLVTCNIWFVAIPEDHTTATGRVRSYRERMRKQGMRPIQMWVADVRAPAFATEARRQSVAVAAGDHAADDEAFIDALSADDA